MLSVALLAFWKANTCIYLCTKIQVALLGAVSTNPYLCQNMSRAFKVVLKSYTGLYIKDFFHLSNRTSNVKM